MKKYLVFLFFVFSGFFIFFQSQSVFGGDGGDLVSAICVGGVPHPQGYPLFTILGRLIYLLPWFTPAWRVSLLSSIPAAGVVTLVFYLIYYFLRNNVTMKQCNNNAILILAALIGSSSLAFSYLFWLYASVPEVFSLNNLFLMILLILTVSMTEKQNTCHSGKRSASRILVGFWTSQNDNAQHKLYLFSFVSGLAIFHHYFNLWFVIILGFFVCWHNRNFLKKNLSAKFIIYHLSFIILGALPYLYVPLAARTYPVISWENAVNLENFLNLLTRARYGGFATQEIALSSNFLDRWTLAEGSLKLILQFFGWPGMVLSFLGLVFLWQKQKKIFRLMFFLLIAGFLSLFYIGLTVTQDDSFGLGIYSRFTLPLMVLISLSLGLGVYWLAARLSSFFSQKIVVFLILLALFSLPLSLFIKNNHKILALKNDMTAENFSRDILSTVPQKGILFLVGDTMGFNTWYVRYCLNERTDLKIISAPVFTKEGLMLDYQMMKRNFPDLVLNDPKENVLKQIIELNSQLLPIYTNQSFSVKGSIVPMGLLSRYYSEKEEPPSLTEILKINQQLWSSYHDPLAGILGWFKPVTLSDILTQYKNSLSQTAVFLFNNQEWPAAEEFFLKALEYDPKDTRLQLFLAQALSKQQKCQEAEEELLKVTEKDKKLADPYFYLAENARDCFKDKEKEEKYRKIYEEKNQAAEQNLQDLGN